MKNDKYTQRSYDFEMRAAPEEEGVIEGRPIVFESKTNMVYFDEIIHRGALDKTNLKDVRFLINHNKNMVPLARSRNNNENSTMRLMPDKDGLKIRLKLDIVNNTDARSLYSAIQRGDITGMSFLFSINGEEWENFESDHPTRHIRDIGKVLEVSAVTFPAYEETEISARAKDELESLRALESARSKATPDGDKALLELQKLKNHNRKY